MRRVAALELEALLHPETFRRLDCEVFSFPEPWLQTAEEKLRWLSLLLPLVGVLWAAVPADEFRILVELMVAVTAAVLSGCLVDSIPRVPPLLGMMLAGATLKHLNVINLPSTLAAYLRSTALAITLLRGDSEKLTYKQKSELYKCCVPVLFFREQR